MKSYFIYQKKLKETNEEKAIKVNGYLYTDKLGRRYGARKVGKCWEITELTSGLLCNIKTISKRAEIQDYINEMAERIENLLTNSKYHIELIQRFNELKRKVKEDENGNI